jgi:rRNA maturation endonuclease Nob1
MSAPLAIDLLEEVMEKVEQCESCDHHWRYPSIIGGKKFCLHCGSQVNEILKIKKEDAQK